LALEGRDKFCKAIQYGSRILKWYFEGNNEDLNKRFGGLFEGMKTARKLFRLFKTLNEYHKFMEIVGKGSLDQIALLNAASRVAFGLYWIFDNLSILSSVKFLGYDAKQMNKYGSFWWFVALVLGQAVALLTLADLATEEAQLRKKEKNEDTKKQLDALQAKKFVQYLNVIKQLGDMVTSSQAIELPAKFGFNFNEGHIGVGGFVSAVITMYQLY
jgi:peroxin-11B